MQTGNRCKSKANVGKQKQRPCGYKTTSLVAQHTLYTGINALRL